jgi:hypothetical protein
MASNKQKKHCADCVHHWTQSVSGNHCCKFGKDAAKAYGQCINTSSKTPRTCPKADNK